MCYIIVNNFFPVNFCKLVYLYTLSNLYYIYITLKTKLKNTFVL